MASKGSEVLEGVGHKFTVDSFSWVVATDNKSGEMLKRQSVETLLLYEILRTLQRINYQGGIG